MKHDPAKKIIAEYLRKIPIIQFACEKASIGRTTYYRWRQEDIKFREAVDKALNEGRFLINDLAESKLISLIKDNNLTAVIYWLKTHHPSYTTRLEIINRGSKEKLTPEQERMFRQAIKIISNKPSALPSPEKYDKKNDKK